MPVADTELLFGLIPGDRLHRKAVASAARVDDLVIPEVSIFEFSLVLRSRGTAIPALRRSLLNLRAALAEQGLGPAVPLSTDLLIDAARIEDDFGLDLFDSLIGASGLAHDGWVVSDDDTFDAVDGLHRVGLGRPWSRPPE